MLIIQSKVGKKQYENTLEMSKIKNGKQMELKFKRFKYDLFQIVSTDQESKSISWIQYNES